MKKTTSHIGHRGLVRSVQGGRVTISLAGSGCSACHSSLCMLGESKAKIVELPVRENKFFSGEAVWVHINPASGYLAVVLLYLLPFLLMMVTLLALVAAGYAEWLAGLAALFVLVPYFLLIYLLRDKLSSRCRFEVTKQ